MGAVQVASRAVRAPWVVRILAVAGALCLALLVAGSPAHAEGHRSTTGTVSGRVTDTAHRGVAGVRVEVLDLMDDPDAPAALVATATTGRDGRYTVRAVPVGTYRVHVVPREGSGLATVYWPSAPSILEGQDVVVRAAKSLRHVDVDLAAESRVVGAVRDAAGLPVAGVRVTAKLFVDGIGLWLATGTAVTSDAGTYTVRGLPAGTYVVGFESTTTPSAFLPQYYPGATFPWQATPISLGTGMTAAGIDASLVAPARITGTVRDVADTPVAGAQVTVFRQDGTYFSTVGGATTSGDGTYAVEGLAPGDYRVSFGAPTTTPYPMLYYPGVTDFDRATTITVAPGAQVTDIDASFGAPAGEVPGDPVGGSLRGVVRDDTGSPLQAIDVYAFRAVDSEGGTSWSFGSSALTGTDGGFELSGLPAGTYRLAFIDLAGSWTTTYYLGADTLDLATSIEVVDGATVTGLDVQMAAAAYAGVA